MPRLSPFLLVPQFLERPWGTRSLAPIYTLPVGSSPIGEAWLTGDECRIASGPHRGRTLAEVTRELGRDMVGDTAPEAGRFPLLVKFIFPRDKLSIQVHPDDETARRAGLPNGKNECWYVVAAEPGARIALGLKPGTTRAQLEQAIRDVHAEDLLNWVEVRAGEMVYVPAGTVHTIGPGMILLETQQNSDTTYRLYDYGRPRPLHIREGLEATKEVTHAGKIQPQVKEDITLLAVSPFFFVTRHTLARESFFTDDGALREVRILVTLRGCGVLGRTGTGTPEPLTMGAGDTVVVPASAGGFQVRPQWEVEFLRITLPFMTVPEPETKLATETPA